MIRFISLPATILCLCAASGMASAAPAKGKKPPAKVDIENGRGVSLTQLEILASKPDAKAKKPATPLAKLDAPLSPGEKKTVSLKGVKGCNVFVRWTFEDAGDEGPADLCREPRLLLTD